MKQNTQQLAALLRDMADRVEQHDSYEGYVSYVSLPEPGMYDVKLFYRYGNAEGQGFSRSSR